MLMRFRQQNVLRASLLPTQELDAARPSVDELIEGYGQTFGSALHERWEAGGREIAHAIEPIPREDEDEDSRAGADGTVNPEQVGGLGNGGNEENDMEE